ncbi:MAG: endonuclease V [Candidatus Hydrothermales bacterium]
MEEKPKRASTNIRVKNFFNGKINLLKLREYQLKLSQKVKLEKVNLDKVRIYGALDVGYRRKRARGAYVIYDDELKKIIYEDIIEKEVNFPYIPTFLSFREIPVLSLLYKRAPLKPHILFIDGQGILHPARCGIATHFGVLFNAVTIGIAKKKLEGFLEREPEKEMEYTPIYLDGKISGYCLRISRGKKFLWISPGNLITPEDTLFITLKFIKNGTHILMKRADALTKKDF